MITKAVRGVTRWALERGFTRLLVRAEGVLPGNRYEQILRHMREGKFYEANAIMETAVREQIFVQSNGFAYYVESWEREPDPNRMFIGDEFNTEAMALVNPILFYKDWCRYIDAMGGELKVCIMLAEHRPSFSKLNLLHAGV